MTTALRILALISLVYLTGFVVLVLLATQNPQLSMPDGTFFTIFYIYLSFLAILFVDSILLWRRSPLLAKIAMSLSVLLSMLTYLALPEVSA